MLKAILLIQWQCCRASRLLAADGAYALDDGIQISIKKDGEAVVTDLRVEILPATPQEPGQRYWSISDHDAAISLQFETQ